MKFLRVLPGLLMVLPAALLAAEAAPVPGLHALFDSAWQRDLEEDPLSATAYGDPRHNDRLPDLSAAAIERSHQLDQKVLEDLAKIPRAALPPAEQLNYDLFEREYQDRIASYPFKPWLYRFSHRASLPALSETVELISFDTAKDYQDWIGRLRHVGTYVDQNIALLEQGMREKRTQPKVIMQRVPAQIAKQLVAKPQDSPFYAPLRKFPAQISAADQERLAREARAAITEVVIPAYRRLDEFFAKQYLPKLRATDGIWDTRDGAAYYQNRIAYHTTTNLTADQIHEIGLKEVARIHAEMEAIIAKVGFKGTFQEFLAFLRTDRIDFFKANAAKTDADIVNEIDRYISWPGQALAYKIGQLKIRALRDEAQQRLGDRFDIREFHDTVLGTGAVPLDVLESTVHDWIARKLASG
ncbi:MAG TPA: DUF885 domain-containing protein [Steroidobacteraceae bacterium]|nr:DUF885 domain-containing protein [Steroidobacteraceae bacterium]